MFAFLHELFAISSQSLVVANLRLGFDLRNHRLEVGSSSLYTFPEQTLLLLEATFLEIQGLDLQLYLGRRCIPRGRFTWGVRGCRGTVSKTK